ncbi:MAG: MarR family transcriptional regulator [Alphaproteobacteria bacterium]|uniref:MarR family winged helix-turn-helix transcriptional regulator n=1 Tax=Maricaulis alexandrii TaxID=2570354 RepID=UPI0011083469|nr:MarR family transcriptional regulator [Maricaulis alexandrii]MCR9268302.1 MarR family transcriptional regulator [Alphaproteobacteria bacterium]
MPEERHDPGAAALGGRLRRLSDRIDREAKTLYEAYDTPFEQRWLPTFNALRGGDALSVQDLADRLGVSHVSVSVTRTALEKAGLIQSAPDGKDGRRRVLTLTDQGKALSQQLAPLFDALNEAAIALNAEAGDAIATLARLEAALDRESLSQRVTAILQAGETEKDQD